MAGRTFKELENEKDYKEFCRFAKAVTESYADSQRECSQKVIAKDNNITVGCLRKLMDYSIKICLVSRSVADKTLNKAIFNQQRKKKEAGSSSIVHFHKLITEREEFIAYSVSSAEIRQLATEYAEKPEKSISYLKEKYKHESERVTKLLLRRAIVENIISDEMVSAMIERSIAKSDPADTEIKKRSFQALMKVRDEQKKE